MLRGASHARRRLLTRNFNHAAKKPASAAASSSAKPPASASTSGSGSGSMPPSTSASSSSSSSSGASTLLLLTLATPIGVAAYVRTHPEWNPELLKDNANWLRFRSLALGDTESAFRQPAADKQQAENKSAEQLDTKPIGLPKPTPVVKKPAADLAVREEEPVAETPVITAKKQPVVVAVKKSSANEPEKETPKADQKQQSAQPAANAKETAASAAPVTVVAAPAPAPKAKDEPVKEPVPDPETRAEKRLREATQKATQEIRKLEAQADPALLAARAQKEIAEATKFVASTLQNESEAAANEIEKTYLAGLDKLDSQALALRVAQLATEMKHRAKWEAVKLYEALKQMEEQTNKKTKAVLRKQEETHKELVARELRLQEELLLRKTREEIDAIKRDFHTKGQAMIDKHVESAKADLAKQFEKEKKLLKDEYEERLRRKLQESEQTLEREKNERKQELEMYNARYQALKELLDKSSSYESISHKIHKVSVAALALSDRIEAAAPLRAEIRALREAGQGDEVIETALKTLPRTVIDEGAPSVRQLQERFKTVKSEGRRAALVPEDSGLAGQILARVLSNLMIAPAAPIEGDDAEAIFSRADYAIRAGDLEKAIEEMQGLTGEAAEVSRDWVDAAKSRLAVEQTSRVVKAHIALLAASLS